MPLYELFLGSGGLAVAIIAGLAWIAYARLSAIGDAVRPAVAFVQGLLAQLGCFRAVGEPPKRDGTFEALTAGAVIAFQQANGLLNDARLDRPGVVRPGTELRLLARPFPFVFGPEPCPARSRDRADGTPTHHRRAPEVQSTRHGRFSRKTARPLGPAVGRRLPVGLRL